MKKHIKIVSVLCCLLLCTAAAGGCNLFSQNNSQSSTAAESQSQSSSDEESIDSETSAQENKTEESSESEQQSAEESSNSEEETSAGSDAEEGSDDESSEESSYVSMTESEAMEASNEGYEFDDEQIVTDYHTAETFTDNEEFNEIFKGNSLDREFDEALKNASSSTEMRNIISEYGDKWKNMANTSYSELSKLLDGEDAEKLNQSQSEWDAGLSEVEESFYEEAKTAGSEGLIAADTAIMNYYKGRAAKLFEQIYTINGSIELSDYGL